MDAKPHRLKNVFRSDVRLTVPLFQRPYVWNLDLQWLPLWEDVLDTAGRAAHGDVVPHFLGAVVLEQQRSSTGSLEVRQVIDGQQRLTTLQLLIAAVRDGFLARDIDDKSRRRLTKLLENDADSVDEPDERHKLWPTNRDRDAYRRVMNGDLRATDYSASLPRIEGAYAWFRDALDDHLSDAEPDEVAEELIRLAEALLEHLELVVIDLGESDNAQVIFETLNARGTPLRASDLIKNSVFRTLQDAGRPVEKLYNAYWEAFEGERWQADIRQGRLTRPRLDAFMGYLLVVLQQREVQALQLFPSARSYVRADPDRAEEFLAEAARYAGVYEELESGRSPESQEAESLARMQVVDTQTMMPLLMWLFANTAGPDRLAAVQALESYVVRRALCRLTTKNYNRLFLELLRRLGTGDGPAGEVVTSYLTAQGSESGMWPTDAELTRSLERLPLYRLLKRDRLQRALLALEIHATSSLTEPISTSRKLSIEHLMPQSWQTYWPLPDDGDATTLSQEREDLIHTLGNLTLVTGPLNSTLSNGAWPAKRHALLEHSSLTLNRTLPEHWTVDSIRARSAWLAGQAVNLWPRPAPASDAEQYASDSERELRPDRDDNANSGTSTGSSSRRDIGRHIEHVFKDLQPGEFLTVAQIRRIPSPEYTDAAPSPGAISARLFPSNGGATTIPGVVADSRNGVRGATKR
jgi:hypothetical protein